jgi:hypothetical protein
MAGTIAWFLPGSHLLNQIKMNTVQRKPVTRRSGRADDGVGVGECLTHQDDRRRPQVSRQ